MKSNRSTLTALLNLVLLLSLLLALPAPALGQGPGIPDEASAQEAPQVIESVKQTVQPEIDCSTSPAGENATLWQDNEIVTAQIDSDYHGKLRLRKFDNNEHDNGIANQWSWYDPNPYDHHRDNVAWPAVELADLDGDGKDELISAFADSATQLQLLTFENPEARKDQLVSHTLESDVQWRSAYSEIDLAVGNLDGAIGGDEAEEVVMAFLKEGEWGYPSGIEVWILDGSDGGVKEVAKWGTTDVYKYNFWSPYQSVAVGDLDGDGVKNEIALAFSDTNRNLRLEILQYKGQGVVEVIGTKGWGWVGGIDLATGNFDKDDTDEVAIAVVAGGEDLLIISVGYDKKGAKPQDRIVERGQWKNTSNRRGDVGFVSVASADIDGDGRDEIVSAFMDSNTALQLVTLDAQAHFEKDDTLTGPQLRGTWAGDYGGGGEFFTCTEYLQVKAGDIDKDGKSEVVVSVNNCHSFRVVVLADTGLPEAANSDDLRSGLHLGPFSFWQPGPYERYATYTGVALGDIDGNNMYAEYDQQCAEIKEAHLIAIVNQPPYWQDHNAGDNLVAYGTSVKGGSESSKEVGSSFGSSISFTEGFKFAGFGFSASISEDWAGSLSRSWTHGSSKKTNDGWFADDGFVAFKSLTYDTYLYHKEGAPDQTLRVSAPVDSTTHSQVYSSWNADDGARADYPTSWVPAMRSGWMDRQDIPRYGGWYNQGAGSDYYDINGDDNQDYLFAWLDNPGAEEGATEGGYNYIYYHIGWSPGEDGTPARWSNRMSVPHALGERSAGLGAAVTQLNNVSDPDLVVAWVDAPDGENSAYYIVGWDLDAKGVARGGWSKPKQIPGWVGGFTQGAGLDMLDINNNNRPEMFFGWIDNPAGFNDGWYRVGWDLDEHGNSSNQWSQRKEIEGAFGPWNYGLGLTLNDWDGGGQTDLIAAWVRDPEKDNDWAYSIGENLDGNAHVDYWSPGQPVPGGVGDNTAGAALASADLTGGGLAGGDGSPELMIAWIDQPSGQNKAYMSMGKIWPFISDPDKNYPADVRDTTKNDGKFEIKVYDQWWNVSGDLLWRWDRDPILVEAGGAHPLWSVDHSEFSSQTDKKSFSFNLTIGAELEIEGSKLNISDTWGFERGHSQTTSWEHGFYMEGRNTPLSSGAHTWDYKYVPFTYTQATQSANEVDQAYMVLDYYVPWTHGSSQQGADSVDLGDRKLASVSSTSTSASDGVKPGAPEISSSTHASENGWYSNAAPEFSWMQPIGDPSIVDGYRWYMDHEPDTIPETFSQGLIGTTSYEDLSDGLWYLHVRARGDGGDWSDTAHRSVRVDLDPPQVELNLKPSIAEHQGGWYAGPFTLTVHADDGDGSGVDWIEISTDGVVWQPYTDPIHMDAEMPLTTYWARTSDQAGHVSEPVSTTIGLDQTIPDSNEGPGCWSTGGNCIAEVVDDSVGNQHIRLTGEMGDDLSGAESVHIQINGEDWLRADKINVGKWTYTSDTNLGAGCYTFQIQSQDKAGNIETLHAFGDPVLWRPRTQPDFSGSNFWVTPDVVRPGERADFRLTIRNAGWQETWAPVEVELPHGLTMESISAGGQYDANERVIRWAPRYLRPGDSRYLKFSAWVDSGVQASTLDVVLNVSAEWPISPDCPPGSIEEFQPFVDEIQLTAEVSVNPDHHPTFDTRPPLPPTLSIDTDHGQRNKYTKTRQVTLETLADPEAVQMYLSEWVWSVSGENWVVAQQSGWLPYAPTYNWTLSEGDGVKYVGVWVADDAGNISRMESSSLALINLLEQRQSLGDGERIQYRFPLGIRELAIFNLVNHEGNSDLHVWRPLSGFRPHYSATGTGLVDTVGFEPTEGGLFLVEVEAVDDSTYQLQFVDQRPLTAATQSNIPAETLQHPLTVSDPLSAGVAVAPTFPNIYLPMITTNH